MGKFERAGEIAKIDEDQQLVFGWASISENADGRTIVDAQNDVIVPDELEKAVYDFVLFKRDAGEMHERTGVGQLVESVVTTREKQAAMGLPPGSLPVGHWVGFKLDSDVFEKVKKGELTEFSYGGKGKRVPA